MSFSVAAEIADLAEELCEPRQHREPVWEWNAMRHRRRVRDHVTTQPGLLRQLHQAVVPMLSAPGDSGGSAPPRSRPPLQMEAYSRYDEITVEAAAWVKRAGLRVRPSVQANVRALVGKAAALPTAEQRELLASMRRWRGWAATMTGWQALYTPRAACPVCEAPELRVNLSNQAAVCVACGSTWAADTIGILADHIAGQQSAHERVPIKSTVAGHGAWTTRRS